MVGAVVGSVVGGMVVVAGAVVVAGGLVFVGGGGGVVDAGPALHKGVFCK